MIILLHSSKTMRKVGAEGVSLRPPVLLQDATTLDGYIKTLSPNQLKKIMHISLALAEKTHRLIADWSAEPAKQSLALDCFVGDIYRGLRAADLSVADRDYADKHLYILSGLYGCLRPYDGIMPYRLEMMYKLPAYKSLYEFWGQRVADCLPQNQMIVNLSSVEYARMVTPFIDPARVYAPEFLTVNPKTKQPTFVAVHAKVARGAFARWMIQNRVKDSSELKKFNELNYVFDASRSATNRPTFVCQQFGGLGLTA